MNLQDYPTIYQDIKFPTTSDRYLFIPTIKVINELGKYGWYPHRVMEKTVRDEVYEGHQKHLVVLRNGYPKKELIKDGIIPEMLLTNSHIGDSSFKIQVGIFRIICSNGLVVSDTQFASERIIHKEYNTNQVMSTIRRVAAAIPGIIQTTNRWQQQVVNDEVAEIYTRMALNIRWPKQEKQPIPSYDLLYTRRPEDKDKNLWNLFNIVQENIIEGVVGVRRLKNFTRINQINQKLWRLTEETAVALK